jgi:Sulfotransferase domain
MWPFKKPIGRPHARLSIGSLVKRALLRVQPGDGKGRRSLELLTPPVFHVTHWKSGSQWVNRLLHNLMYDRLVVALEDQSQFFVRPIERGKIYPTVYVTREQFYSVRISPDHRRFVIIRDLRDTMVSMYFSVMHSHDVLNAGLASLRCALVQRSLEEGMLFAIDYLIPRCAVIQESWVRAGEPLIRYEDFLTNDLAMYEDVLLKRSGLPIDPEALRSAVAANRFERLSGGRKRGQENVMAHERKGIEGDWKNYFTDRIARLFKQRYGDLLIQTGYEKNHSW